MDILHLSYREVVYEIPYRNLVIMQKDKLRECFGEKINKVSGRELAARRKRN